MIAETHMHTHFDPALSFLDAAPAAPFFSPPDLPAGLFADEDAGALRLPAFTPPPLFTFAEVFAFAAALSSVDAFPSPPAPPLVSAEAPPPPFSALEDFDDERPLDFWL